MARSFDELVKRTASPTTRRRAARRTRELLAELLLSEIRKLAGRSQRELADTLGIRQPSLSKLENQDDMQISTLQRIVEALGGKVQILARFPQETVRVKQFDRPGWRKPRSGERKPKRNARDLVLV
jgi:transcriptional regulator with XRE-family HTH domain